MSVSHVIRLPRSGARALVMADEELGDLDDTWPDVAAEVVSRVERLLHPTDRLRHRAARQLAALCVADLLRCPPDAVALRQICPTCAGTDHGQPGVVDDSGIYRNDVHVSWSHGQFAVAAVAAFKPVAIDVEAPVVDPPIAGVLAGVEQRWLATAARRDIGFAQLWSRKECAIKLGLGTLDVLEDLVMVDARLDLRHEYAGNIIEEVPAPNSICVVMGS